MLSPLRNSPAHRTARIAFTLIELLAVIALVALLAALLYPALNSGRARAKNAQCLSNLRQLGAAMLAYAAEHDGLQAADGSRK